MDDLKGTRVYFLVLKTNIFEMTHPSSHVAPPADDAALKPGMLHHRLEVQRGKMGESFRKYLFLKQESKRVSP